MIRSISASTTDSLQGALAGTEHIVRRMFFTRSFADRLGPYN